MRFYLGEKRAVYRETELPFTKSEYEICEYLALHRGQVFSREQIYEHVFGYDGESDSSAITERYKKHPGKMPGGRLRACGDSVGDRVQMES